MTSRLPEIAADIRALMTERGVDMVDIPVLQPADPFLDMAGEDLRRRIFLTESETGAQLCLRPEFTIPVCLDHIATRAGTPKRYGYLGEVFRQRREGSAEFFQAGIEDLGTTDRALADARSIADARALVARSLGDREVVTTLGDQRIFEAVLAALGLPRGWQKRLARAFGSRSLLDQALADLASPAPGGALDARLAELVTDGDEAALAREVATRMSAANLSESAGRSSSEIAKRLLEKTELRSVRLAADAMDALQRFLDIRVPLDRAEAELRSFADGARISLAGALETFAARAASISEQGLDASEITYDAAFGRPLDYYTGLVFEIALPDADRPLVGGGRYDRLLTLLGAAEPIPGVGFSVWLDRIEQARGLA